MIKRCRAAPYELEGTGARRVCACVCGWVGWGRRVRRRRGAEESSTQRRSEEELYHSVADWQWKWGEGENAAEERCSVQLFWHRVRSVGSHGAAIKVKKKKRVLKMERRKKTEQKSQRGADCAEIIM